MDEIAGTAPLTVRIHDESSNQNPTAVAGPNQELFLKLGEFRKKVTLDGSSSFDPDGFISTYEWSGPSGSYTGEFFTLNLEEGAHEFSLVVTDEGGARSKAEAIRVDIIGPPSLLPAKIGAYQTMEIYGLSYGTGLTNDGATEKMLPIGIIVPLLDDPKLRLPWYLMIASSGFKGSPIFTVVPRARLLASAGMVVLITGSRVENEMPVTPGDEQGDSILRRAVRAHLADTQKAIDWIVANSVTEKYALNLNWGGIGGFSAAGITALLYISSEPSHKFAYAVISGAAFGLWPTKGPEGTMDIRHFSTEEALNESTPPILTFVHESEIPIGTKALARYVNRLNLFKQNLTFVKKGYKHANFLGFGPVILDDEEIEPIEVIRRHILNVLP